MPAFDEFMQEMNKLKSQGCYTNEKAYQYAKQYGVTTEQLNAFLRERHKLERELTRARLQKDEFSQ